MYEDGTFPPNRYRSFEHDFAQMAASAGGWKAIQDWQGRSDSESLELARRLRESMVPMRLSGGGGYESAEESG
jgi:hypothetical protein